MIKTHQPPICEKWMIYFVDENSDEDSGFIYSYDTFNFKEQAIIECTRYNKMIHLRPGYYEPRKVIIYEEC